MQLVDFGASLVRFEADEREGGYHNHGGCIFGEAGWVWCVFQAKCTSRETRGSNYDRGEPAVGYKMNRSSLRNNWLKFKTAGKLLTILE